MSPSRFSLFNVTDVVYKVVNDHPLKATILIPKNVKRGKCPLLVHFHGGGLVVGDRMFEDWLIQLAEFRGAIIVSPDYRLIPESTGSDILDDVESFWNWVHSSLSLEVSKIASEIDLDLSKIAAAGESAGGFLSIQSALLFPDAHISLVISQYGMLDIGNPCYNSAPQNMTDGLPRQDSLLDRYVNNLRPGAIRLSSLPLELLDVLEAMAQEDRHREFIGTDDKLYLIKSLERAKSVPAMWVIHGKADSILLVECSEEFARKLEELHPETPMLLTLRSGGHGFDTLTTINNVWVQEGCDFVGNYWP
ncbi:MAG: hypothetical protein M1834_001418 [Cirrosporium novae-zelandiae]|nr:MAG: hypothetical protein M1834_001418 [Cirrosporium novae-zelandiae]